VRVPAAPVVCLAFTALAFVAVAAGAMLFAGDARAPGAALLARGAAWALLANGTVCVLATGIAALSGSRTVPTTMLIGWELVLSPILVSSQSLGSARHVLVDSVLLAWKPGPSDGAPVFHLGVAAAALTLVLWAAAASGLGPWRMAGRDL
jgi:hypothetical protein